ncbi:MAG: hypothetical protein SPL61_05175 [Saccharofermentans sp.]|nr:hypothetical protein [Saccharofermentans sp.]
MRGKRVRTGVIIALLVLVPAIVVTIMYVQGMDKSALIPFSRNAQVDYVEQYTDKLNARNADIIFYKKDPIGPSNFKARRVNALNDLGLKLDQYNNPYHVLVLNDLDGGLNLTVSEIQAIIRLYDSGFRIIYLGTAKMSMLAEYGVISSVPKAGTKSVISFKKGTNGSFKADGFADDPISMPISDGLTDEEVIIYTMVMELAQKDIYWTN